MCLYAYMHFAIYIYVYTYVHIYVCMYIRVMSIQTLVFDKTRHLLADMIAPNKQTNKQQQQQQKKPKTKKNKKKPPKAGKLNQHGGILSSSFWRYCMRQGGELQKKVCRKREFCLLFLLLKYHGTLPALEKE